MSTPLNAGHYRIYTAAGEFITEPLTPQAFHDTLSLSNPWNGYRCQTRDRRTHSRYPVYVLSQHVIGYEEIA